jgi:hypothetical protein
MLESFEDHGDTKTPVTSYALVLCTVLESSTQQLTLLEPSVASNHVSTSARESNSPQQDTTSLSKVEKEATAINVADRSLASPECGTTTDTDGLPKSIPIASSVQFPGVDTIQVFDDAQSPQELKNEAVTTRTTSENPFANRTINHHLLCFYLREVWLRVEVSPTGYGGTDPLVFRINGDEPSNYYHLDALFRRNDALRNFKAPFVRFSIRSEAFPGGIAVRFMWESGESSVDISKRCLTTLAMYVCKAEKSRAGGFLWRNTAGYHGDVRFY